MANLGTIYDSQDLPQKILPDCQPEDWEAFDSADEEVEGAGIKRHLRFLETSGILMFG